MHWLFPPNSVFGQGSGLTIVTFFLGQLGRELISLLSGLGQGLCPHQPPTGLGSQKLTQDTRAGGTAPQQTAPNPCNRGSILITRRWLVKL